MHKLNERPECLVAFGRWKRTCLGKRETKITNHGALNEWQEAVTQIKEQCQAQTPKTIVYMKTLKYL